MMAVMMTMVMSMVIIIMMVIIITVIMMTFSRSPVFLISSTKLVSRLVCAVHRFTTKIVHLVHASTPRPRQERVARGNVTPPPAPIVYSSSYIG